MLYEKQMKGRYGEYNMVSRRQATYDVMRSVFTRNRNMIPSRACLLAFQQNQHCSVYGVPRVSFSDTYILKILQPRNQHRV